MKLCDDDDDVQAERLMDARDACVLPGPVQVMMMMMMRDEG